MDTIMSKAGGFLQCCSSFSLIGMVYLTMIAIILNGEPEYIRGFNHRKNTRAHYRCIYAAMLYGLTFVGCKYLIHKYHRTDQKVRKSGYGVVQVARGDIDDAMNMDDDVDTLKKDYHDEENNFSEGIRDFKKGKGRCAIIALKNQRFMNAKVIHSDEASNILLAGAEKSSSPTTGKRPKPRKGD
jgi:hypothetical protein